jgi:hypothetical protein
MLEPAIAHGAAGAAFLPDEVDEQRRHFVALVPIANHGDPDAQVEPLQAAFGAADGNGEVVCRPCLHKTVRNLARAGVVQNFGQGHNAGLAHIRRIGAVEVPLDLVERVGGEQLDEIRRDVAQDRLPAPERARRTAMAPSNLRRSGRLRQRFRQR